MTGPATPDEPAAPGVPEATDGSDGLAVFDAPPAVPGEPEPTELAYAETPAEDARIAHPVHRAFAFFLDGVATVVLVVVIVLGGLTTGGMELFWAIPLVPLAATILDTVLTARYGGTPAKAILGLRVVDAGSGAPIGFGRAILRSLVIVAPIALGFAVRYRINPVLMGLMVVNGATAGGFSPISIFGSPVAGVQHAAPRRRVRHVRRARSPRRSRTPC